MDTKNIIEEFGTVKRFCDLKDINYNFQNAKGQIYLSILFDNNFISFDYYRQCKDLYKLIKYIKTSTIISKYETIEIIYKLYNLTNNEIKIINNNYK
jgi:glutaredoxin-related protein